MQGYKNNLDSSDNLQVFFSFAQNLEQVKDKIGLFKLSLSISTKRNAIRLLREEVVNQIPNWIDEFKKIETLGYCSGEQSLILLIKYQVFLNAIYTICENYAYLGSRFVPNISPHYNNQYKKIEKIKDVCLDYAEILEKNHWYNQVHTMRSEATHFFDGTVYTNNSNRPGIVFRDMAYHRGGVGTETAIDIPDIEAHVNELVAGVDEYTKNLCMHLFTFIRDDFERSEPCMVADPRGRGVHVPGFKKITFAEYCKGAGWRCEKIHPRSEERRVGKECRSRWSPYH